MSSVLVLYASTHGHTAKIAARVAAGVESAGVAAELRDVKRDPGVDPVPYDAVIAGGSLHAGSHQPELLQWVKAHADALNARPGAFFSVSLTAAEDTAEERQPAVDLMNAFLEESGWTPQRSEIVAGALQYLEYDRFTRTLVRLMMKRGGHPTDTSQDYDYTDWDAVERLGREFASGL
jgi:menaquinone-dependent protoporphyrinogen oxidase